LKANYRIFFSSFLLAVILFAAIPKVYIHSLLGHTHEAIENTANGLSFNNDKNTKDCDFEKFDVSVYYTVFKFILSFLPLGEIREHAFFYRQQDTLARPYVTPPLRGPPVA